MKRSIKNIITCAIIAILMGAIVFTGYCAKKNISSVPSQLSFDSQQQASQDTTEKTGSSGSSDSSSSQPPEMPQGGGNMGGGNMGGDGTTPPEKPDGDTTAPGSTAPNSNGSANAVSTDNSSDTESSIQELPDSSTSGGFGGGNMSMPDISDIIGNTPANVSVGASLTAVYYILFALEAAALAAVIMYLILSGFNKKDFAQTFGSGEKTAIYVLSAVLLALVIFTGSVYVTNNFVLTSQSFEMPGNGQSDISYSASAEITQSTELDGGEYTSTSSDQNALSVSGDITVSASNLSVEKSGSSDGGDNTSFYGTNSAIIAKDGAQLTLKNITVNTDAVGANGVFSYGGSATTNNTSSDGTTINISDSTITTLQDGSGGIMTTGGGTTNATNLTVTTAGTSSAAIRTDRGGGTVTVKEGTYKTTGQGSPAIYSTANVTVEDAELISEASEGVIIEGKNSVTLKNVTLTDNNTKLNGQSTSYKNIFLYQSVSGDASDGTSEFYATDCNITTEKGDTFYITNTSAVINLSGNTFTNNDNSGYFLRAKADSWGDEGSNGGDVTLNLTAQAVSGNIYIDSVSSLDMTVCEGSSFAGAINSENCAKSISLTLDKSSVLTLTADCYVTELNDADTSYANINFNGYKLYVNGSAIN